MERRRWSAENIANFKGWPKSIRQSISPQSWSGPFVDHDALDRTDLLVIRSVNRSALNLVAADQGDCLSLFLGHQILLLKA